MTLVPVQQFYYPSFLMSHRNTKDNGTSLVLLLSLKLFYHIGTQRTMLPVQQFYYPSSSYVTYEHRGQCYQFSTFIIPQVLMSHRNTQDNANSSVVSLSLMSYVTYQHKGQCYQFSCLIIFYFSFVVLLSLKFLNLNEHKGQCYQFSSFIIPQVLMSHRNIKDNGTSSVVLLCLKFLYYIGTQMTILPVQQFYYP